MAEFTLSISDDDDGSTDINLTFTDFTFIKGVLIPTTTAEAVFDFIQKALLQEFNMNIRERD